MSKIFFWAVTTLSVVTSADGITFVGFRNFDQNGGQVFVDESGQLLPVGEARLFVGTYTPEFISTIGTLDAKVDLPLVLSSFSPLGAPAAFVFDGLVNRDLELNTFDDQADTPLYLMITHTPDSGSESAMVLGFGTNFPVPDGLGNALGVLGPGIASENILFGGRLVEGVDNSSLPGPLSGPAYSRGVMIGVNIIPEPGAVTLALFGMVVLLTSRRRV